MGLSELADSSVNFTVRVRVDGPDYWGVFLT
jgi:small conductance mechanosensitive channel